MAFTQKIHIISYLSNQVVFKNILGMEKMTISRLRFERKLRQGFYEVLNPELIPGQI